MMLRDNFPTTKEDAKSFDVEIRDEIGVFKVFELEDSSSLASLEKTIIKVNEFLVKNGFDSISPIEFIKNDFNYESEDERVSLSKHGYLEEFVLFIERENYINLNKDTVFLLNEFFKNLKMKAIGYSPARNLNTVLKEISELPVRPKQNAFVSLEYDNSTYHIAFSDYKIEFSNYVQNFDTDENGNKSNFESYEASCFSYGFNGQTDVIGDYDQFREELLFALNKVNVTDISISEEE
ncbi:hypothetical protein [Arenibacter sp. F20364]|uniref:hypothetical protein n=1 Tax=Arenibacter sp. F20364 TaxID=2926415 RepID=UPI001FF1F67A|nr:hypothetical protein [Arenibacter sp. F20364]MCK0190455.1 hypothetical protein [Arenibacter sp. F20364]